MPHPLAPRRWSLSLALAGLLTLGAATPMTATPDSAFAYPPTREAPVTDTYHGEAVVDPYRWLEMGDSAEVKAWVTAQNRFTRAQIDPLPMRQALRARLQRLVSAPREGVPGRYGKRLFFTRHDGKQPQSVLMVEENGQTRVLLDPNTLSTDGSVSLDFWEPSPDGDRVAYGLSQNGDEKSVGHVLDVKTGDRLPDVLPGCRYASLGWLKDQSGFYYTRFDPAPDSPNGEDRQRVFFHRLGTNPAEDPMVFEHAGGAEVFLSVGLSRDDRWVMVMAGKGKGNELHVLDRQSGGGFKALATGFESSNYGDVHEGVLYLFTTDGAPRGRVMRVELAHPGRDRWKELIPQAAGVLQYAYVAGGRLLAGYLEDAHSRLRLFGLDGQAQGDIQLPGLGTVGSTSGRHDDDTLYFNYTSYLEPSSVYRYDLKAKTRSVRFRPALSIDTGAYEERQVWYPSKDGTRIPMMLVHKKGLPRDGQAPTLLTGYGGFGISMTPGFSSADFAWVERGGVLAVPGLRGGGEFGDAWHEAGMLERKQNVFDDFIAAAEYLVAERITSPLKLGIQGGSNGGLLMGAMLTQRPELFKAVVCGVPLLDMLRYHQFLIARYWVPEYGSSENADQYRFLKAYSPYHRVKPGTRYPATLIVTGESDTRVDPLHARKMAALLQRHQAGPAPVLLYVETKAGHGAGKPLDKWVETTADTLGFLAWQLGVE
jgi:prolyl oligopeptidase